MWGSADPTTTTCLLLILIFSRLISGGPFQPSWKAKNFLSSRQRRSGMMTGATEECCNEQCSLQEIAEYPCS